MIVDSQWRDRPTITVDEAATILGISRNAAYEAIKREDLPALHIGRRIVIPVARLKYLLGEVFAGPDIAA